MSQKANLFSGIIGKNLSRMNEPDADEVVRVSKLTGIHEFILRLPKGYDTEISLGLAYLVDNSKDSFCPYVIRRSKILL